MVATVKKIGGSVAVIIPKSIAADAGLGPGTTVEVSQEDDAIVLRRSTKRMRKPITELVRQIDSDAYARHRKASDDRPVGKEVW
jgi:AbrB family looped-hinge helix DNA binding protein